jgi:hypothetical protein
MMGVVLPAPVSEEGSRINQSIASDFHHGETPGVDQAGRRHAKPGRHDPQHPQIANDCPQADRGSDYSSATP